MRRFLPAFAPLILVGAGCGQSGGAGPGEPAGGAAESAVPRLTGDTVAIAGDPYASATLAVQGTTLYWVDESPATGAIIGSVSLPGGTPRQLAVQTPDATATIVDLAVDGTNAYVIAVSYPGGSTISRVEAIPLDGGPYVVLASATGPLIDLTLTSGQLYFSDGTSLWTVPTTDTAWRFVEHNTDANVLLQQISGLASHAGVVYWTQRTATNDAGLGQLLADPSAFDLMVDGKLMQLTGPTATPTEVATVPGNGNPLFAANDTQLFWITNPVTASGATEGEAWVVTAPVGGGAPRAVASVSGSVVGITADASNVYVLQQTTLGGSESLLQLPIGGGAAVTLASGISGTIPGNPRHALATDGTYVYFVSEGGIFGVVP